MFNRCRLRDRGVGGVGVYVYECVCVCGGGGVMTLKSLAAIYSLILDCALMYEVE